MRKLFGIIVCIMILGMGVLLFKNQQSINAEDGSANLDSQKIFFEGTPAPSGYSANLLLVNFQNPLTDDFHHEKLVTLYDFKNRHFELGSGDIQLEESVYEAMEAMFAAAKRNGIEGFIITSGYRNREQQQLLAETSAQNTAAAPGQSEHETGLAFDVTAYGSENGFDKTEQFEWLLENCWDYGFILRYPEGKEDITGITYEPWHYRFVGVNHAQIIRDNNLTLEEYLET